MNTPLQTLSFLENFGGYKLCDMHVIVHISHTNIILRRRNHVHTQLQYDLLAKFAKLKANY